MRKDNSPLPSPLPPSFPSLPSSGSSPAAAVSRNWFRTGSSALSRTRPLRNEPARRTRDGTRTKPKDRLSLPAAQLAPASPRLVTSGGGDDDDQSARGSCVSSRVKGSPPRHTGRNTNKRASCPRTRVSQIDFAINTRGGGGPRFYDRRGKFAGENGRRYFIPVYRCSAPPLSLLSLALGSGTPAAPRVWDKRGCVLRVN